MDKTNQLLGAKQNAKLFLNLPVAPSEIPFLVYHPFIETSVIMDSAGTFDINQEPNRFQEFKKTFCSQMIEPQTEISGILNIFRKPYRLTYLKYLLDNKIISKKECGNLLAANWTLIEILNHDKNVTKQQVLSWIKAADKDVLMNSDDLAVYKSLPETVTIYRGCQSSKSVRGLSWSLNQKIAEFFKNRFGAGHIYSAKINKLDILAYINTRKEEEIIVDYRKLVEIKEID